MPLLYLKISKNLGSQKSQRLIIMIMGRVQAAVAYILVDYRIIESKVISRREGDCLIFESID